MRQIVGEQDGFSLVRRLCDRCGGPILLARMGLAGEYCSTACRDAVEAGPEVVAAAPHRAAPVKPQVTSPAVKIRKKSAPAPKPRGSAGGQARAAKLSPERRKEIARAAIAARWKK